jgi:thiol-disulfide isomerase/thioredoxin
MILVTSTLLLAGCADVVVQHGDHPDGPVPSGAAAAPVDSTPFAGLASPPDAAAVAALSVAPLSGGSSISLGGLLGSRATVIAFWETTCAPCAEELPGLQRIAPALRAQGVTVILVDVYDSASDARGYLAAHAVTLPSFYDGGAATHDALRLLGVPTTALLGAGGSVVARLEGSADNAGLAAQLASMGISTQ